MIGITQELATYAKRLLDDPTISEAFDHVLEDLERNLFDASTPEDRERIFQERAGVVRVRQRLIEWVTTLELEDHYEH